MTLFLAVYCCGIITWVFASRAGWLLLAIIGLCITASFVVKQWRYGFLGLLFFAGVACVGYHAKQLQWPLAKSYIKKKIIIDGIISNLPKKTNFAIKFQLKTLHIDHLSIKKTIALSCYYCHYPIRAAQHWQFLVRLKPAHGLHNPGGFNYQAYLIAHQVVATGYVVKSNDNKLLAKSSKYAINHWRGILEQHIKLWLKPTTAAIITALTVGSKTLLTQPIWRVFQRTGTSHLVAISGLHLGLVASIGYFIFNVFARIWPRLLLYFPAPRIAALGALLFAVLYALLAGFSWPTQRAVIMLFMLMSGVLFSYRVSVLQRLLLAFALILTLDPFAITQASFCLSFSAVGVIAYALVPHRSNSAIKMWWRTQIAVALGLIPITLWFFQQVSLILILANLIAIPWVSFIIVPLCLLAACSFLFSPLAAQYLFLLAAKLLQPLWWLLSHFAAWPWAVWHTALSHLWLLAVASFGMLLLLAPRAFPARWLGLICGLPLLFYQPARPKLGEVWLTVLDVGQGLASVIETQHHVLIYDTGPKFTSGFNTGTSVVVPYLRWRGIKHLNLLMISHGDNDHIGGAGAVLQQFVHTPVLTSIPSRFPHAQVSKCHAGQHWQWDGVKFRVLYPLPGMPYRDNNSCCVLRIATRHQAILLTGDIERVVETYLLKHDAKQLSATVLVAPHHGSKTSSSLPFVDAVDPRYVVFAVGYYNRFGFPSPVVVGRYQRISAKTYSTAEMGAIRFKLHAGGQVSVTTAVSVHRDISLFRTRG